MSESQSECFKKTNHVKFSEKGPFFTLFLPDTVDMTFSFKYLGNVKNSTNKFRFFTVIEKHVKGGLSFQAVKCQINLSKSSVQIV